MRKSLIVFACLFVCALDAQNEAMFDSATAHYNKGDYDKAVEKYEQILNSGVHSSSVYYNLGNSYYKLNKIAPSIYYYEKALLLDPNDSEIKNNLAFARNMTLDDIEPLPQSGIARIIDGLTGIMTFNQWAYMAVAMMMLFAMSYIVYYYLRYASHKRLAFIASVVFLFASIVSVTFSYLQYNRYNQERPAIVFASAIAVRSEPNARSQESFVLHEGTKVQVLDELDDWRKIALEDGSTGWLREENIKMLKDF
jgi:tetratricopeptide (TPR) repeat protein